MEPIDERSKCFTPVVNAAFCMARVRPPRMIEGLALVWRLCVQVWNGGLGGQCPMMPLPQECLCKTHASRAKEEGLSHGRVDGPIPLDSWQQSNDVFLFLINVFQGQAARVRRTGREEADMLLGQHRFSLISGHVKARRHRAPQEKGDLMRFFSAPRALCQEPHSPATSEAKGEGHAEGYTEGYTEGFTESGA